MKKTSHDRNHTRKRIRRHQCGVGLNCLDRYQFYPQQHSFLQKEVRLRYGVTRNDRGLALRGTKQSPWLGGRLLRFTPKKLASFLLEEERLRGGVTRNDRGLALRACEAVSPFVFTQT